MVVHNSPKHVESKNNTPQQTYFGWIESSWALVSLSNNKITIVLNIWLNCNFEAVVWGAKLNRRPVYDVLPPKRLSRSLPNQTTICLALDKDTICLTISDGLWRSIKRLWIRIWKRSHVLDPSPHGVFLVVIRNIFVGIRTGPFTFSCLSLAPLMRSAHTENMFLINTLVDYSDKPKVQWTGSVH